MKALQFPSRNQMQVVDLPQPEPNQGEALVRVHSSGICHTDVEILRGNYPTLYPVVPGHEFAGTVEAVGPGLSSDWVGKRIVVDPNRPCRECSACRAGLFNKCIRLKTYGSSLDGGFQEFVAIAGDCLVPIADLPFEEAALAEPLACVLHGVNRLTIPPKGEVLIFGAGPIGVLMQVALQAGDAKPEVTVVDLQPSRLEKAKRLGAAEVVLADKIRQEHFRERFSVVIDATGAPSVVEQLPWYTRDRGTILLFGVCPPDRFVNYSPYEVYYRELTIQGSYSLNGELPQALGILSEGKIPTQEVVTHRISLEDVPQHLSNPGTAGSLKIQAVFP
jgi:2-desacetyl-2-hydroxyethyl bacteriochlorophyllide A dehydrogenase